MTDGQIEKLAVASGLDTVMYVDTSVGLLRAFASAVEAIEREACAKICDAAAKNAVGDIEYRDACFDLGVAIRKRSNAANEGL